MRHRARRRRARQVQGIADRAGGRRPGRGRDRRASQSRASTSCGSRSPTAATAPSTPRSRPGYERIPVRADRPDRRAGRHRLRGARRASRWSRWPTSPGCGCCRRTGSRRSPRPPTAPARSSAAALDRGCRSVVLGIGGSASTDGGAGMLAGARRAAARRRREPSCRAAAARWPTCDRVDLTGLHPRLAGAADRRRQRRRQPAARPARRRRGLRAAEGREPGRRRAARRRAGALGGRASTPRPGRADVRDRAGAGAAGGVGYAAMAVLGAELEPGIELVLDLVRFADHLPGARLVITGEGSLDEQTLHGKAPAGVASAAAKAGVPVVDGLGPARAGPRRSCGRPASTPPTP